jgi:putative transcriptional regulator
VERKSKVKNTADPCPIGAKMIEMPNEGDLLIAPPNIPDTKFRNSVLLMTHDDKGGSLALCLNKPSEYTTSDILDKLDLGFEMNLNFPLYWGGPISPTTVWMLHERGWEMEGTIDINNEWCMTSSMKMFAHLADGDMPNHFRLLFGFCSWAPEQLKAELRGMPPWSKRHSWLVAKNPGPEWIMEAPVDELWRLTTELSGHQAVDDWL